MEKKIPLLQKVSVLVIFETLVVITAIFIIVASGLIAKHIYGKVYKSRADSLFLILNISDIGVAILSMTALGIHGPFRMTLIDYFNKGSRIPLIITLFFYDFPYIFSYILTTVIAIDRLFIITKQKRYENFVTKSRLKKIVVLLFAIIVGFDCVTIYYFLPHRCCNISIIFRIGFFFLNLVSTITIAVAYVYILFVVQKRSNKMLDCKHNRGGNTRRLSRTIFYIFVSQIFCIFPYLILFSITMFDNTLPYLAIGPWLVILRNSQCFFNGLVLLKNQKKPGKGDTFLLNKSQKKVSIVRNTINTEIQLGVELVTEKSHENN